MLGETKLDSLPSYCVISEDNIHDVIVYCVHYTTQ